MVYLLKVLSDIAPKPSTTFSIQICPKPIVQVGPINSFYLEPLSSYDIATARNPRQFGHTDMDLGLTEMALQTLCCMLQLFQSHRNCNRSHRVGLTFTLLLIASFRSH